MERSPKVSTGLCFHLDKKLDEYGHAVVGWKQRQEWDWKSGPVWKEVWKHQASLGTLQEGAGRNSTEQQPEQGQETTVH